MTVVHATALAFGEAGLLVRGPAGAGKSTLALALLARAAQGGFARLVADDRVILSAAGGRLVARAPPAIAGLFEAYGVGILPAVTLPAVRLTLVIDLVPAGDVPRLPDPADSVVLHGVAVPRLVLPARAAEVATVSLLTHLGRAGLTESRTRSQRAPVAAAWSDDLAQRGAGADGRSM